MKAAPPLLHEDLEATGCVELAERLIAARNSGIKSARGMHSIGGWHTERYPVGEGWLGGAMRWRLELGGCLSRGLCWASVLPPGAEYGAHTHSGHRRVAVWCLTDSGSALHIEPDIVIPDHAGQLVFFSADARHWVPKVDRERVTVAVNLS